MGEDTNGATVTPLLTTSDASYSKLAGYELDTYDKEEGDLDGPFTLAVSVEAGSGQMVWFSSSAFLDDKYNALSSGANVNLGMNALSSLVGESEAMAIRSKSLNYNYLTISASTSSLPVSYTHLDVYKRQASAPTSALSPSAGWATTWR